MRKAFSFAKRLFDKAKQDEVMSLANELTYKGLLALFPFIIFLMTLLGFFNINSDLLIQKIAPYLPSQVMHIFIVFVEEVIDKKSPTLLSTSLLVAVYSASSGFKAIMRGINKAHGITKKRGFIVTTLESIVLELVFAAIIIISLVVLIFGDIIKASLTISFDTGRFSWAAFNFAVTIVVLLIILFAVTVIYKVSLNSKISFVKVLPGATLTVVLWILASEAFNAYINTFSRYSVVYGSIGSIFILVIWINIVALILLIGSEVNALLDDENSV